MPNRIAQNVSLTPQHAAFIAELVASGRYGGVSEVVRAALRVFERQEIEGSAVEATKLRTSKP